MMYRLLVRSKLIDDEGQEDTEIEPDEYIFDTREQAEKEAKNHPIGDMGIYDDGVMVITTGVEIEEI